MFTRAEGGLRAGLGGGSRTGILSGSDFNCFITSFSCSTSKSAWELTNSFSITLKTKISIHQRYLLQLDKSSKPRREIDTYKIVSDFNRIHIIHGKSECDSFLVASVQLTFDIPLVSAEHCQLGPASSAAPFYFLCRSITKEKTKIKKNLVKKSKIIF